MPTHAGALRFQLILGFENWQHAGVPPSQLLAQIPGLLGGPLELQFIDGTASAPDLVQVHSQFPSQ